MTHRTVLVLGARPDALHALCSLGAEPTCVLDAVEAARSERLPAGVRTVIVQDPSDSESVLAGLARAGLSTHDFDAICAPGEGPMVNASVLAGRRARATPEQTLLLRDKSLQKQRIRTAGIPVADCWVVHQVEELTELPCPRGVLKPLDGTGTIGVRAWKNDGERVALAEEMAGDGPSGPWLAEEWVEGEELHIDGVVRGGEVRFASVSRYLQPLLRIRDGGLVASVAQTPARHPRLNADALELARRTMTALDHRDGVFHLEAFQQSGHLVFGECAGRVPGAAVDGLVHHQHGVDLDEEWARAVLGHESALRLSPAPTVVGMVSLSTPAGVLRACPGREEITAQPGVVRVTVRARPGEHRTAPTDTSNRPAALAVVESDDEEHTAARIHALARWFTERSVTTPPDPGTA